MGHSATEVIMTDEELDAIFQPQQLDVEQLLSRQPEQLTAKPEPATAQATLVDERWLHMLVARRALCGGDYEWAVRHQDITVERFLEMTEGWKIDPATKKLRRVEG